MVSSLRYRLEPDRQAGEVMCSWVLLFCIDIDAVNSMPLKLHPISPSKGGRGKFGGAGEEQAAKQRGSKIKRQIIAIFSFSQKDLFIPNLSIHRFVVLISSSYKYDL